MTNAEQGIPVNDQPRRIVIINGGTSNPSSTRMLADRIADKTLKQLHSQDITATVRVIELGPLAGEIAHSIVAGFAEGELLVAINQLAEADGIIAATPVYKAGISGLFKAFMDILDNDLLVAKPIVLSASAGTGRHALVVDDQLRPLFAYMRALTMPTSVFAAPEDWADPSFTRRIERAGVELSATIASGVSGAITGKAWGSYQHSFGSNAQASGGKSEVNFDSDLMRLATGGTSTPPK